MKRILLLLVAGTALSLSAASPASGVKGTMHDLSAKAVMTRAGSTTVYTQTCVYCHAPHISATTTQLVPLWNHNTSTNTTFTMYNATNAKSDASQIKGVVDAAPTGVSLACISCHDGSIAVGSIVVAPYGTTTSYTASSSIDATGHLINHVVGAGGDFTSDHPIAVTYDSVNDLGLVPADTALTTAFGGANVTTVGGVLPLFSNKVQCASCHDVHNWSLSPKTGQGGTPFLRMDNNTGSALCITCHKK